jgi:hypothetical protein
MPKVNTRKNTELQTCLMISMIKPLRAFKLLDWLFIKEEFGFALWPVLREF